MCATACLQAVFLPVFCRLELLGTACKQAVAHDFFNRLLGGCPPGCDWMLDGGLQLPCRARAVGVYCRG